MYLKRDSNLLLKTKLHLGRGVGWFQGDLCSIPRSLSALVTHPGQVTLHLRSSVGILKSRTVMLPCFLQTHSFHLCLIKRSKEWLLL